MITQLSLWEAPVQDMQVPGVPHLVYLEHSWADGDTRPDQLVRLSHVILGDLAMFDRSDGGPKEVYRIVSTGVVDGKVVAAYEQDRKSTRLNSSHGYISYAVFCLKKKKCTELRWAYCNHKATYFASYLTGGDCVPDDQN